MRFLDLAKDRYTTKKYNPNRKISDEKIQELKEILRLSPSSINSQPWKFIFVADERTKRELANASYFNKQKINEASHLVVFTAIDVVEKFEAQIHQYPLGSVSYYNQFLKPKGETEVKYWMQHQVYLALGFFLSACVRMEIDSTPMEGIQHEEYDSILQLKDYKTLFAVAIGYRDPSDANQPSINPKSRLPLEHIIQSL
ncbi:oxygen-insensitive NAD(P)H nitroreductase [Olivibacter ginsenosidimutans]|uniref:Oxygen-insensitive NAD(P)H nitroreductase n=1 Tax=Olivibacter ginsenosidimutans TaxID=1176537 RepID=A0ABP9CBE3_9SPHI